MQRILALAIGIAAIGAAAAAADPTPAASTPRPCRPQAWTAARGTVSAGRACQVAVLTTDAGSDDRAAGRMQYRAGGAGAGRYAVTVQRLSADPGSIQIEFPGGWLVLGDGQAGVYTSEAQWATHGYRGLPAPLDRRPLTEPSRIELVVTARDVSVRIEGVAIGRWPLPDHAAVGSFAVWINGARGARARVRVSDWVVPAPR